MAQISFRSRIVTVHNRDGTVAQQYLPVPVFTKSHCAMTEFRTHPQYGAYANSDLFLQILAKIRRDVTGDRIYLDNIPPQVIIDKSAFLHTVTFNV